MANTALSLVDQAGQERRLAYVRITRFVELRRAAIPPRLLDEFHTLVSMFGLAATTVLLVASLTVGTLLLVRGEQRRRDVAIRLALGASRRSLVVEAWIEGLLPAIAGGLLALPVAYAILRGFAAFTPRSGTIFQKLELPFNMHVLIWATATALAVSAIVTAISCRVTAEQPVTDILRADGPPALVTRRYARRVLVLVQVASAMALLASTLLLVRSLAALYGVDLGYRTEGLVEVTVDTLPVRTTETERRVLFETIERDLHSWLPSVPVGQSAQEWVGLGLQMLQEAGSHETRGPRRGPSVRVRTVSPGYLEALGIQIIEGRTFSEGDTVPGAQPTALISARLAQLLAPDGSALGIRLGSGAGEGRPTVIGVVGDIRPGPLERTLPTAYILIGTLPEGAARSGIREVAERIPKRTTFVIRTPEAAMIAESIRLALSRWPGVGFTVTTAKGRILKEASAQRFGIAALGLLSLTAVSLAMLSIFVLITSTILARMRELSIRVALGATTSALFTLLARDTLVVVAGGLVLGAILSFNGSRLLQTLLFGIQRTDPLSLLGAACLLFAVSLLVLIRPIVRAARRDPFQLLRES